MRMNKEKILSYSFLVSAMALGACFGHAIGTNSAEKRFLKYEEEKLDKVEKSLKAREKKLEKSEDEK